MNTEELFKEWFRLHPDQKNPTDLNTQEKWDWMMNKGFPAFRVMQQARKRGEEWSRP